MGKESHKPMPMGVDSIESPANGRDESGRPYCGRHNVLMTATRSADRVTHYRCPVQGCGETGKRARNDDLSSRPSLCQLSPCQEVAGGVALVADSRRSSVAQLAMVCPQCGNTTYTPRPGSRPRLVGAKPPERDFADR